MLNKIIKNNIKSEKAITLIALVITIIVLLILAGISIAMLTGDNGILQKATDAKTKTERQSIIEQARTDVLGYQAENRGGDLEKAKLKAILDTYFKEVPNVEELPDGEDLLKREFTTQDKYGTYTIKVSEIYNGNIAGDDTSPKAATLFEDKAGDEDGTTEGKIHIGDYVNYNPIADGDTGTEAKYKYQSLNDNTGVTEAISASKVTGFTDSSQNFTAKSNLKWIVIGKDGDNVLITVETPIIPDNPVSVQTQTGPSSYETLTGYFLYGAKAYVNISPNSGERNEINNIAQKYGNGKGSDSSKTRGMTIEDVNKITGVTANGTTLTPSGINMFESSGQIAYGTELTDFKKGTMYGWTPESWIDSNIDKSNSSNAPGITGKTTGYAYQGSNSSLKTASSTIRNNLIFGESNSLKLYWLASRAVTANETGSSFGACYVAFGNAYGYGFNFNSYNGLENGMAIGVRPVIYLDSKTSLTSLGTTNKVTTWNID